MPYAPEPPLLAFAPAMRSPKKSGAAAEKPAGHPKDTLRNIRETGEFVINVVTFELAEAMNLTSGDYDTAINEFEVAKLASAPSKLVRPRRVAESPVSFECKLHQILDFNPGPDGSSLVIGEIVSIHVDRAASERRPPGPELAGSNRAHGRHAVHADHAALRNGEAEG